MLRYRDIMAESKDKLSSAIVDIAELLARRNIHVGIILLDDDDAEEFCVISPP